MFMFKAKEIIKEINMYYLYFCLLAEMLLVKVY